MGLVDGEQVDLALADRVHEAGLGEALRRAVDDPGPAVADLRHRVARHLLREARGDHHRRVAVGREPPPLVGHQRDQRADHDGELVRGEPGELVAEALAAAGGHDDQRVAAGERGLDGLALPGPEAVVAEVGEEGVGVARAVVGADGLRGLGFEPLEPVQRRLRLLHLWKRGLRQILAPLAHPPTMAQSAVG